MVSDGLRVEQVAEQTATAQQYHLITEAVEKAMANLRSTLVNQAITGIQRCEEQHQQFSRRIEDDASRHSTHVRRMHDQNAQQTAQLRQQLAHSAHEGIQFRSMLDATRAQVATPLNCQANGTG